MQNKIKRELERGVYVRENNLYAQCQAYKNINRGWINYLISDAITFSHRENDYEHYDYPYALETHDYYELIIYSSVEDMHYIADGHYFNVPKGAALLIKPNTMHMLRLEENNNCERYVINFRSPEKLFPDASVLEFLDCGNENYALFIVDKADKNRFSELCSNIENSLLEDSSKFQRARAILNITALFIALSETRPADIKKLTVTGQDALLPSFIIEVKNYIDENYLNINSVSKLSENFHYNKEYLTRSFRKHFNIPIWDYIIKRRLMYCCTLLDGGEFISAAALKSGFYNRASFTKLFKRYLECTPSEYIKGQNINLK